MKKQKEWNSEQLETLKKLYRNGHTIKAISRIFKVSEDTIREQIVNLKLKGEL